MKKTIQDHQGRQARLIAAFTGTSRPAQGWHDLFGIEAGGHMSQTTPQLRIGSIEQREQNWDGSAAALNDSLSPLNQLVETRGLAQGCKRSLECPALHQPGENPCTTAHEIGL